MEDFNKNDRSKIYQRFSIHGNFWHTSLPELMDQPNNGVSTAHIPSWPLMEAGKICDQMKICDHYFEFNLVNLLLKSWISWSQICLKNYLFNNNCIETWEMHMPSNKILDMTLSCGLELWLIFLKLQEYISSIFANTSTELV